MAEIFFTTFNTTSTCETSCVGPHREHLCKGWLDSVQWIRKEELHLKYTKQSYSEVTPWSVVSVVFRWHEVGFSSLASHFYFLFFDHLSVCLPFIDRTMWDYFIVIPWRPSYLCRNAVENTLCNGHLNIWIYSCDCCASIGWSPGDRR
jgi:hypothetical protein